MHLEFVLRMYQKQLARGTHFLHEHPATADSWEEDPVQELLERPGVGTVVGHMRRQGMKLLVPDGEVRPVQKPTRWASSASEVLKRLGLRCTNETCRPGDPRWHQHTALEGRLPGGQLRTQAAAHYPPALCASILRGVAAQYAREGRPMPKSVQKRLDEGRAVYDLGEGPQDPNPAAEAHGTPSPHMG